MTKISFKTIQAINILYNQNKVILNQDNTPISKTSSKRRICNQLSMVINKMDNNNYSSLRIHIKRISSLLIKTPHINIQFNNNKVRYILRIKYIGITRSI
jgi:hypothetical protein